MAAGTLDKTYAPTKQVLVRCRWREPMTKVGRDVAKDPSTGRLSEIPLMRQFRDYECYMSPEEAAFIVDSKENTKARAQGAPMYWYPAGAAVPVAITAERPLPPPLTSDQVATADPQQAEAAREQMAELERLNTEAEKLAADGNEDVKNVLSKAAKR